MPRSADESLKPLWILAGVVGLVLVYGIVGFRLFGFGLVDAVYMTVLPLNTLGFGDGGELGTAGKLFTVSPGDSRGDRVLRRARCPGNGGGGGTY
jgi:hypothetical protein